jgi:hypothetical protein
VWKNKEIDAIFLGISDQLFFSLVILVVYNIIVFGFLLFVWISIYEKLKSDSKWVNGFILLIPIQMLREN